MARQLRAVTPSDAPEVPPTISVAVQTGTARDVLASMRLALARKLDDGEVSSNAIASAYKELRELDRLIRLDDEERAEEKARQDAERHRGRRSFNAAAI